MPKGIVTSGAFKKGNKAWNKGLKGGTAGSFKKGHKTSKETREKISKALQGEKSYRWTGGFKRPPSSEIRRTIEYRLWREAVFARDNWTCQKCDKRGGGEIHPHHIQNSADNPELRFAIDNGITMCKSCHMEFHKIYGKHNTNNEQLEAYLQTY